MSDSFWIWAFVVVAATAIYFVWKWLDDSEPMD